MNHILKAELHRTADNIGISWTLPKIVQYVVEKRLVGTYNWTRAGTVSSKKNKFNFSDLEEDAKYECRVVGVGKDGEEFPSGIFVFSTRKVKPKILTRKRNLEIVHQESSLNSTILFVGDPMPEVMWTTFDDEPLPDSIQVTTTIHDSSPFTTSLAASSDELPGEDVKLLKLKLKNEHGVDEAAFQVKFRAKPLVAPPTGPLEMTSLGLGDVKLTWEPPVNDGSSVAIHTHYVIEKGRVSIRQLGRREEPKEWIFVARIEASDGTEFIATDIEQGRYFFRVSAEYDFGLCRSEPLVAWGLVKRAAPGYLVVRRTDSHIVINWTKVVGNLDATAILHYDVQRKKKWSKDDWIKVNTAPVMDTVYVDDQVKRCTKYRYRIVMFLKSGKEMTSARSKLVSLSAKTGKRKVKEPSEGIGMNKRIKTEPTVESGGGLSGTRIITRTFKKEPSNDGAGTSGNTVAAANGGNSVTVKMEPQEIDDD